ncbi:MAG: hypothetical protein ACI81L_003032, partial [Verrucomicrobiales bacterium]
MKATRRVVPISNDVGHRSPLQLSLDAAIDVRLKRIGVSLHWRPSAVAFAMVIVLIVLGFVASGFAGAGA